MTKLQTEIIEKSCPELGPEDITFLFEKNLNSKNLNSKVNTQMERKKLYNCEFFNK